MQSLLRRGICLAKECRTDQEPLFSYWHLRARVLPMSNFDEMDAFDGASVPLSQRAMSARPMPYLDGLRIEFNREPGAEF